MSGGRGNGVEDVCARSRAKDADCRGYALGPQAAPRLPQSCLELCNFATSCSHPIPYSNNPDFCAVRFNVHPAKQALQQVATAQKTFLSEKNQHRLLPTAVDYACCRRPANDEHASPKSTPALVRPRTLRATSPLATAKPRPSAGPISTRIFGQSLSSRRVRATMDSQHGSDCRFRSWNTSPLRDYMLRATTS